MCQTSCLSLISFFPLALFVSLKCFQRQGNTRNAEVPGCSGTGFKGLDFCYNDDDKGENKNDKNNNKNDNDKDQVQTKNGGDNNALTMYGVDACTENDPCGKCEGGM